MERWTKEYPRNNEIEDELYPEELLRLSKEAREPNFSWACLHDIAWRYDIDWSEIEQKAWYEVYNLLYNKICPEISRYPDELEVDSTITDATDEELLKWIEDAEIWDGFSLGCLHEIAWRHDLGWNNLNECGYEEDADEACDRIKKEMQERDL